VSELLSAAASRFSDLPFLIEGDERLTFSEAEAVVSSRARLLTPQRLTAVRPDISIESTVEILAALRADCRTVLLPRSWPLELAEQRLRMMKEGDAETVVFSSGSSAAPKAVRLTEANWRAAGSSSAGIYGFGPGKSWLVVLPIFHVGGLAVIFRSLVAGGAALLAPSPSPDLLDEADIASLVPTQLARLIDQRDPPETSILIGGGSLDRSLVQRAEGWNLHRTYGMTETAGVVASGSPANDWMTALPGVEISETSDGRLQIRGPQVSPGNADAAEREWDGWLVTDDLGEVRGRDVIVRGRADRIINSGGEKIDPAEIEGVVAGYPGVTEAVVFGSPDEHWGEAVTLVYAGLADADDVVEHVERRLGKLARPRRVEKVAALPRNDLGKVDMTLVKALAATGNQPS
jgi:O-succinylbenzoic acid--CoA ligase